jgi:phage terminase large subunit-like protein
MTKRKSQSTVSPVEFIDKVIKLDEKGEPFRLAPYQRRVLEMALRLDASGELLFRLVLLSEPKKSGKTFIAACLVLWWACTRRHTEIILVANDEEQATGRVFKTAVDLIEHNEVLQAECDGLHKPDPHEQRDYDHADFQRLQGRRGLETFALRIR